MKVESTRPKIGVGLLLIKNGTHILLGKRIGTHGAGQYAGVGGHMENLETAEQTIMRELREEIGSEIQITKPTVLCVSNLRDYAPKHYIDIGMVAEWISGEPRNMEPEKLESWQWFPIDDLPAPLFASPKHYLVAYRTGQKFFDL